MDSKDWRLRLFEAAGKQGLALELAIDVFAHEDRGLFARKRSDGAPVGDELIDHLAEGGVVAKIVLNGLSLAADEHAVDVLAELGLNLFLLIVHTATAKQC